VNGVIRITGVTADAHGLYRVPETILDHLRLPGGIRFEDVTIAQGNPASNGAAARDSLIIDTGSSDACGAHHLSP
jgi:hypothetical protein